MVSVWFNFSKVIFMRPVKRHGVSKGRSARQFRSNVGKTKAANVQGLARGGWRL